jgi:uridine kinase
VLILEGIFALHDQRVLDMLDLKIFADAEPDLCLSRRLLRDVRERGRDIEGCIKQWFSFVKPNYHKYVEPQRNVGGKSYHPFTPHLTIMMIQIMHSSTESLC